MVCRNQAGDRRFRLGYTTFDRLVALWRFRAAFPHIRPNSKVCDIGCGLGAPFLRWARMRIALGVGLDYQLLDRGGAEDIQIVLCDITQGLPLCDSLFDHAIMLAVLEHLEDPSVTLREAFRILVPGGSLILTWPNQIVDPALNFLRRIRLVSAAMESEKHVRRIPVESLRTILRVIGFGRVVHRTFEFGLNNVLVAHKEPVS
jgi:ubiquinone/menaquinone biosynthesis C-methylase UbiE